MAASTTVVNQAAQHFAANNPIWGQGNSAANVDVALSGPDDPAFRRAAPRKAACAWTSTATCPTARTCRSAAIALPTYFAQLVGIDAQGVRATATAETAAGNQIKCMLPFAVADRWADATDENVDTTTYTNDGDISRRSDRGWSPNDLYQDPLDVPPGLDTYVPPIRDHAGLGPDITPAGR